MSILRLVQPVMPFVAESLWQALGEVAPQRGLPTPSKAEESVAIAKWPSYPESWIDAGVETPRHLSLCQLAGLQVLFHQRVLGLRGGFYEFLSGSLRGGRQVGGDLGCDQFAISDRVGPHLQKINDAAETRLRADGDLDGSHFVAEARPQRLQRAIEAGILTIETVYDDQPADAAVLRQRPGHFGLHLDAGHRVHNHDGRFGRPQGSHHFADKVWITRGVDQVDFVACPLQRSQRRIDRVFAPLFLGVEVGGGRAVVNLPQPVDGFGGK